MKLWLYISLIFILVLPNPGHAQNHISLPEKSADRQIERGKYHQAIKLYNIVLSNSPHNERVQIKLARAYHKIGDFSRSMNYYSPVINKKYLVSSGDYLKYAEVLSLNGEASRAGQWAQKYLEIDPRSIIAQNIIISSSSPDHQDEATVSSQVDSKPPQEHRLQTTDEAKTLNATLLEVRGLSDTSIYVLTADRVIEVKEGQGQPGNWLDDLMNINGINISRHVWLDPVYYPKDQQEVLEDYRSELDKLAVLMREYQYLEFELRGFTDTVGPSDHNQQLSESRARNALNYLVANRIEQNRLLAVGYGESMLPGTDNNKFPLEPSLYRKIRRTEFKLVYLDKNQIVSNY